MTDQAETHDIAAEDLDKDQLLELLDQMGDRLIKDYDTDLRLKALDRALNYQAIHAKEGRVSTESTRDIAQAFLTFLKGE